MKRFLAFLLALTFLFLVSCKSASSDSNDSSLESTGNDTTTSFTETSGQDDLTGTDDTTQSEQSAVTNNDKPQSVQTPVADTGSKDNTVTTAEPIFTQIHTGNYQLSTIISEKTTAFKDNYIYYTKFDQNDPSKCGVFERSLTDGAERRVSIYPGDFLNIEGDYLFYRMPMDYYHNFLSAEEQDFAIKANYKIVRVDLKSCKISLMNANADISTRCYDIISDDKHVYYLSMDGNYDLRRMNYDGSNNQTILSEKVASVYLSPEKIYYLGAKGSSSTGINISVADYNGGNTRVIATIGDILNQFGITQENLEALTYIHVYNDWIYFHLTTKNYSGICRIKTDGSGLSKLIDCEQPHTFTVFSDKIFIYNGTELITYDLDGKNKTTFEAKALDYNFNGNKVYIKNPEGGFLINLSNGKKEKIF